MKIEFKTEGGLAYFPGLSKPLVLDSGLLSKAEAAELESLVEASDFFNLSAELGKPNRGAADHRQYVVTIEEGSRRHTIRILEPIEDAKVASLIEYIRRMTLHRRGNKSQPK